MILEGIRQTEKGEKISSTPRLPQPPRPIRGQCLRPESTAGIRDEKRSPCNPPYS